MTTTPSSVPSPQAFPVPEQPDYAALIPDGFTCPPAVRVLPHTLSHLGVVFDSPPGYRPLRLDVHLPDSGPGPHPVVLYAHGGSLVGGVPGYGPWHTLPTQGVAVVSVGYRLAAEATFPHPVDDLLRALDWIGDHAAAYQLDTDRIAGWGSSAGGYLMTMAAARDTGQRLSAVVNHYGPGPLASFAATLRGPGDHRPVLPAPERAMLRYFLGFDPVDEPERAAQADPVAHVVAGRMPPVLLVHGDQDARVDLASSRLLCRGLQDAGVHAELRVLPGQGHAAPAFFAADEVDRVVRFIRGTWRNSA